MSRFVVVEIEGYAIRPENGRGTGGQSLPLLSCSVIDTLWPTKPEVARFSMEHVRGWRYGRTTREQAAEQIRNRAAGVAAILEAEATR